MAPALARRPALTPQQRALADQYRPFAVKVAMQYIRNGDGDDLISEAWLGLCIAASKFDPNRENSFMAYAKYWVRAMVLAYVMRTRGPTRFGGQKDERKVFTSIGKALNAVGHHDPEALARFLGIKVERLESARRRMNGVGNLSMNQPLHGTDGQYFLEMEDPTSDIEGNYARDEQAEYDRQMISNALAALDERSRKIVVWRHYGDKVLSLREIGSMLNLSAERVRQLEARALKRLKGELVACDYAG